MELAAMASHACAACRLQRKRCSEECVLAPYFPSTDLHKFEKVHRVYGTNHIIRMLKDIPSGKRADAVNSMVYEATARLSDPVYGCAGVVHQLQKQIAELESKLADTQADLDTLREKHCELQSVLFTG